MNLLYLSYGTGSHEQEVIFSVLSALHWDRENDDYQILIYTDHPETFQDLPVQVQFISPDQWSVWAGPKHFNHRRKILALKHALEHRDGAVVLVDGDTWLRAPVTRLFDRVEAGRSLMHIREGRISEIDNWVFQKMRDLLQSAQLQDTEGNRFCISPETIMYNSGVVGLDPADTKLLDKVLALADQLCELSNLHVLEQFAFSYVLAGETTLNEADDLVFHYWHPNVREPFRRVLPEIMANSKAMPVQQRANHLFDRRPQPTWVSRGKMVVKRILQTTGIIRRSCRSNEW